MINIYETPKQAKVLGEYDGALIIEIDDVKYFADLREKKPIVIHDEGEIGE